MRVLEHVVISLLLASCLLHLLGHQRETVPHLDPPVIPVRQECGDRISRETVIQLFADAGDSLVIVDVSKCEKAFYIYKGAR